MKQTILYVGLDVDDTQYHGSAFDQHTGAGIDFHCRPKLKGLLCQLEKLSQKGKKKRKERRGQVLQRHMLKE